MCRDTKNKLDFGVSAVFRSCPKAIPAAEIAVASVLTIRSFWKLPPLPGDGLMYTFSVLPSWVATAGLLGALLGALFCWVYICGTPRGEKQFLDNLYNAKVINESREPPYLLAIRPCRKKYKRKVKIYELDMNSISKSDLIDRLDAVERGIRDSIVKITEGRKKSLLLHIVDAKYQLPDKLLWDDSLLNTDEGFKLVLGESLVEEVTLDLAKTAHALFAGSSGSGKTIQLKLALMQCVKKGALVYIADFKGGCDFSPVWRNKCSFVTDENAMLDVLTEIVDELNRRKSVFEQVACADIDVYNKKTGQALQRVIFSCDEITEVLTKNGIQKEAKELVQKIENNLSKIARLGRAYGVHLILATQRPSADVLEGQISNNIDFRICGRANKTLSHIVLDSAVASELIDKDSRGRFVSNMNETTVYQGYWFNEEEVFKDGK
jgi:S-DNA-T family DNA segregation ATPase FtsK/SpoIIIE